MRNEVSDQKTLHQAAETLRIMKEAVKKAQEESRRMGVPNVYAIDGVIHYELPNGELTTEVPEIYRTNPQ